MSEPFLSEIRLFSFNFAPRNWTFCNGQLLPINQNQALFSLMGTNYGGDGRVNFGLPNLQGKVALHMGNGFTLGQTGGEIAHALNSSELAGHIHTVNALDNGTTGGTNVPSASVKLASAYTAQTPPQLPNLYSTSAPSTAFAASAVGATGGSQPHENRMPFLTLNYAIAIQGIFPSRS
jgi:microcystin-dependent protein